MKSVQYDSALRVIEICRLQSVAAWNCRNFGKFGQWWESETFKYEQ